MHELAICQALLSRVETLAAERGATRAQRIVVSVGPLSGVEPSLLQRAFGVARAGGRAATAELEIVTPAVEVQCGRCGARGPARPNRLLCPDCGDWRVSVTQGAELLLLRVELADAQAPPASDPRRHARREAESRV